MKRTKLEEQLRAIGIINTHDLLTEFAAKGEDVTVQFEGADNSRGGHPPRARIWAPNRKTDPKAPWYNHGNKTFAGGRLESVPQALAWACEYTGTKLADWGADPTRRNGFVLRVVRERALAKIKERKL